MSDELEKRVRALENKVFLAMGAFAVFAIWMGFTSFYSIPNAIEKQVEKQIGTDATKATASKIAELLEQSKNNALLIAQMSRTGDITIGGKCFKPRELIRCFGQPGGSNDHNHLTWFDNREECEKAKYQPQGSVYVLAQC